MSVYVNPVFADRTSAEVETYRLSVDGPDFQLAPDFTLIEFASPCSGDTACQVFTHRGRQYHDVVLVHPVLVVALQGARFFYNAATRVNSGYRTEGHNGSVEGSAENSLHVAGMAADVSVDGVRPEEVASFFRDALGAGGVGLYSTHVHVSVGREGGSDRRFGLEWRAIYTPDDLGWMLPQLAEVARMLGVPLDGGGGLSPTDDGGLGRYLASLGGGAVGWAMLGLAATVAVRASLDASRSRRTR